MHALDNLLEIFKSVHKLSRRDSSIFT